MAKTYSSDSLDRFGDDLCEELLSYLSLEEKFKFECISKQWQRVVFRSQTILSIDSSFAQRLIPTKRLNTFQSKLLSLKKQIESTFDHKFKKTEYNWSIFKTILKKCTNILTIDFKDLNRLEDKAIDLIIKHCSHLTGNYINFNGISIETIDKYFTKFGPQLKKISIFRWNPRVDKKCIEKWMKMCINSHSFDIHCIDISVLTLPPVTESRVLFERLNSIHLWLEDSVEDMTALDVFADKYGHQIKTITILRYDMTEPSINSVVDCFRSMRALVNIAIVCQPISSQQLIPLLANIGHNCRRLKSLKIDVKEWTPELNYTFSERFKRLKRLHIYVHLMSGQPLTSHSLAPLKRLTHLRLQINTTLCFTDTFLVNIDHNLPNLQYLDVEVIKTESFLSWFGLNQSLISLYGLRQIRGITLSGNTGNWKQDISKMCVNYLYTNCPKICFIDLKTI